MSKPVFLLTGPSGSGKTSVCYALLDEMSKRLAKPVSTTTRYPRKGEVHGRDYYFVSEQGFDLLQKRGDFLETTVGNGQHYGLLKQELEKIFASGKTPLIVCDTEGIENYQSLGIPYRAVFLNVHQDELSRRIRLRSRVSQSELKQRLDRALSEKFWCGQRARKSLYPIELVENKKDQLNQTVWQIKIYFGLI